jgi:hypothetical protein
VKPAGSPSFGENALIPDCLASVEHAVMTIAPVIRRRIDGDGKT